MIKKIFIGCALALTLVIAIVLILASRQPDSFRLERSAMVKADAGKIYSVLQNYRRWSEWSPWEKLDPAMKKTFTGPDSGVGTVYAWEGNKDVGQGRMEITGAVPASKITMDLEFIKPFKAKNVTEFTLVPDGDATQVTWAMTGPMPFVSKIMCVFVSMDKMVGKDFEQGLANLKSVVE